MREPQPAEFQHSIVIRGKFNPSIFQPSWLAAEELIGQQEADAAKVQVITQDVSIFTMDWLIVEVMQDRAMFATKHEQYIEPLHDLVKGAFTLLSHTPMHVVGLNIDVHFRMPSTEMWHEAGHKLAPKELWEGILVNPGLLSLQMREPVRADGSKGYVNIKVEPSILIPDGLFINVNDHFSVEKDDSYGSKLIMDIFDKNGADSVKRSEDKIYSLYEKLTR